MKLFTFYFKNSLYKLYKPFAKGSNILLKIVRNTQMFTTTPTDPPEEHVPYKFDLD